MVPVNFKLDTCEVAFAGVLQHQPSGAVTRTTASVGLILLGLWCKLGAEMLEVIGESLKELKCVFSFFPSLPSLPQQLRHRVPALRSSSRAHHLHFLLLGSTSPASSARTSHRGTTMVSVPVRAAR